MAFKGGPFYPMEPVQPVCFKYPHNHFNPCWVYGPSQAMVLARMFTQFYNCMEVEYLPVHVPTEAEKADWKLFAGAVRDKIATALSIPLSASTLEDVRLCATAQKMNIPIQDVTVGWSDVQKSFDISFDDVQKHLVNFATLDDNSSGSVDYKEFVKGFGLTESPHLESLFEMLDTEGHGEINFKEYLYGFALLNHKAEDPQAALRVLFETFGGKSGSLSSEELSTMLRRAVPELPSETIQELFTEADCNQDGKLTVDEFIVFAKEHPEFFKTMENRFQAVVDKNAADFKEKEDAKKKAHDDAKEAKKQK